MKGVTMRFWNRRNSWRGHGCSTRLGKGLSAVVVAGLLFASLGTGWAAQPQVGVFRARVEGQSEATAALGGFVRSLLPKLTACSAKGRLAEAIGRLYAEIEVDKSGRVRSLRVTRGSVAPNWLVQCVKGVLVGQSVPGWPVRNTVIGTLALDFRLIGRVFYGVTARGGLEPSWVAGVFEARTPELSSCLPDGAKTKLLVSGIIQFDGTVQRVGAYRRRVPRAVRRCVERAIRTWRFPFGKAGHRTWFEYPLSLVGGTVAQAKPPAHTAAPRPVPRRAGAARSARPRRSAHRGRAGARSRATAAPKVGLLEIRVGATRVPGGVDDKALSRRLGKIISRMKRCGGLKLGSRFKLKIVVSKNGRARLVRAAKSVPPKQAWTCLSGVLRRVRFPVSQTAARGYEIGITVSRPKRQSTLKGR